MTVAKKARQKIEKPQLVIEIMGGEEYRYYPLSEYIVAAPGVCGGRPTIKGRRLDVRWVAGRIRAGETPEEVAKGYSLPLDAVREVLELESVYDYEASYA